MGDRKSFCPGNEEKILQIEAEAAVKEVSFAVDEVKLSEILPSTEENVYMNLKTKEKTIFCVELSLQGFRIVGKRYDLVEEDDMSEYFETIYALLDNVSPQYRQSFGDALMRKLTMLEATQAPGESQ